MVWRASNCLTTVSDHQADDQPDANVLKQIVQRDPSGPRAKSLKYQQILALTGASRQMRRQTVFRSGILSCADDKAVNPLPTRYTSRLRSREALGFRT